jgi:hypothetical protein
MNDPDLRILFACCALVGLSGHPISAEAKAKMAWDLADAMIASKQEEEVGIVSIKRKRGKNAFDGQEL